MVIKAIAEANPGTTAVELRSGKLLLSQPADGGWNFYVDDAKSDRAAVLATVWANTFVEQVRSRAATADGVNSFIDASVTRTASRSTERSSSFSLYMFVGAALFLLLGSIVVLFFNKPQ